MIALLLAAQLLSAAPQADTTLFPPKETVIRLYTDCDEARWPYGLEETFVPKTNDEIVDGVARRRLLEQRWRAWFAERAGDSILPTPVEEWAWPLGVRGRLLNNYRNPRPEGFHEALDIFVPREGAPVLAPMSGVVVAAGDGWRGSYSRRGGFVYEGDGLSRRAGNGVIIFDPVSGGYAYLAHLRDTVLVRAGDVVRRGQAVGRVGHTGNAIYPGRGKHLHLAYKRPGTGCGVDGVLVSENPFQRLRAARARPRRP